MAWPLACSVAARDEPSLPAPIIPILEFSRANYGRSDSVVGDATERGVFCDNELNHSIALDLDRFRHTRFDRRSRTSSILDARGELERGDSKGDSVRTSHQQRSL